MTNLKERIKDAQIDLIKELGIDKLEQKEKEKIIMDIGEILQQRVVIRVVEELPEEKQNEFKEILEKAEEKPELIDEFLKENVPGMEDMILEEIGEYKKGALGMIGQAVSQGETETEVKDEKETIEKEEVEKEQVLKETDNNETKEKDSVKEKLPIQEEEIIEQGAEPGIENEERPLIKKEETDLKIEMEPVEDQVENKTENKEDVKINSNKTEALNSEEEKEFENSLDLDLDKKAEELSRQNISETGDKEFEKISEETNEEKKQDYREVLNLKESPVEPIKPKEEEEESLRDENSNLDDLKKEQVEDEVKILEENKIDNEVVHGEELDLSSELEKMEDGEEEDKK